eukprot:TRINITY_DN15153_c0_g1_i1.p1 TRINITY_DN15153_c0_g1~~TRINITY_DN15153_c0_g1_i1.p1  ORF type:complete len:795 (+),score=226.49 TRINITY_DN15153_c0_g1_i1:126-2510(+)
MLANQNLLIETIQAEHRQVDSVLTLLGKVCSQLNLTDTGAECEQVRAVHKDTETLFATLRDASTADLSQVLQDVKKYATDVVATESRELQATLKKKSEASDADVNDKFKKLESRVLSEIAGGGADAIDPATGQVRLSGRAGDSQLLKKMTNRLGDFEAQVSAQLQAMSQDVEKKLAFLGSQRGGPEGTAPSASVMHDMDALKYDIGEIKDMLTGAKSDTAHVKRIVLACERDMEDFTAAMDAVNVDLDEMRARVDSTHSIITSRQRVEATVTAEISTMRLDMGDMQEALKAHDAWMEDVSQSLQEAHERCHQLGEDITESREQTQAKLDAKTDVVSWNDMNDDIDASIKTVRDMASALRLEVDSRRRKVDEYLAEIHSNHKQLDEKVDASSENIHRRIEENMNFTNQCIRERKEHSDMLEGITTRHAEIHQEIHSKLDASQAGIDSRVSKLDGDLRKQDEDLHKEINDRVDGVDRQHAQAKQETQKRLNALDLRISGLQGASGEAKRDINKLRDEVNSLTVKSAAHDVDIGKSSDDIRKLERQRAEDVQRHKQDMDAVYEELDQKVYEKSFQGLEDNVCKLTRGTVKLCQVLGVFPGARMNDGTDEELDVDVELLNWEDCAQNLVGRVDKTWRQASSQKYRSILDLVSKKADHSVLRLLQISQQHIESQLDRVRHERELWKEVVDKRAQQPLQLALTLKDPHTGAPLPGPGFHPQMMGALPPGFLPQRPPDMGMGTQPAAGMLPMQGPPLGAGGPGMVVGQDAPGGRMKDSPLSKPRVNPPNSARAAPPAAPKA